MSKVILVVDDSTSVRQLVGIALRECGYTIIEAQDGSEALKKLAGQKVDLVVSDVNMPNMDGITMVKEIKKMPNYKFMPVIMLTTEGDETKKLEGKAAGAKAWIVKPFRPEQLVKAVSMLLM
ncbi:MAG TPA: response regulator [Cellvibrionaceae bacterium]|nr:response regulator [Cellvibrionaceae bacterium]